jgi:serine/threonine-protein kinase
MTPAYASPEQALGLPVTTATDVYQLGLILYELLCGRRPRPSGARTLEEVRRWIDDAAFPPPSRGLDDLVTRHQKPAEASPDDPPNAREIARRRRISLERLRSSLRGDLDQIVMKALKVATRERYPSAAELATDLERYRAGRPVHARPLSPSYRARKFLSRHPWGGALSLSATMVIAYLGLGLVSQYRATVVERDKAAAVSSYMTEMFARTDPWEGGRDTLSAIALLQEGARRLDEDLADQPLVRAAMSEAIGRAMVGLGHNDEAGPLLESSLSIRRELLPPDHPDLAASLDALGQWLAEVRRHGEAEPVYRERAEILEAAFGAESPELASALSALGYTQHLSGRASEAEARYAEALRIWSLPGVPSDRETAETMSNLGWLLMSQARLDEAEEWMRRAYDLRLELHGPDHPRTANSLIGLSRVSIQRGEWESGLNLSLRALETRERYFPVGHPWIGDSYSVVGDAYRGLGRFEEATASYREGIRIIAASRGPRSSDLALTWNNLALMLREQGRFAEAEEPAREAMAIYAETRGERHLFTAIAAHNLASILAPLERLEEAEELYRFSLDAKLEAGPASHPGVAQTKSALGGLLLDLDRPGDAEPLLREALEVQLSALGRGHWQTGLTLVYLGEALEDLAGPGTGIGIAGEGLEALRVGLGADHVDAMAAEARVADRFEVRG